MKLTAIYIASQGGSKVQSVESAAALAGRGLEGDRYLEGTGTFSRWEGTGRSLTLIAQEVIDEMAALGFDLSGGAHRRNLVTEGIDLDNLIGKKFLLGEVELRGERRCLPCRYLERRVAPGLYETLKRFGGGLRAEILSDGILRVGDRLIPRGSTQASTA